MREILEAIKLWIISKFEIKEYACEKCEAYEQWLDKEIEEKEQLRTMLYTKLGLIREEITTSNTEGLNPVRRHVPLRVQLARAESKSREKLKQEVVEKPNLSEAEHTFEQSLKEAKVN